MLSLSSRQTLQPGKRPARALLFSFSSSKAYETCISLDTAAISSTFTPTCLFTHALISASCRCWHMMSPTYNVLRRDRRTDTAWQQRHCDVVTIDKKNAADATQRCDVFRPHAIFQRPHWWIRYQVLFLVYVRKSIYISPHFFSSSWGSSWGKIWVKRFRWANIWGSQ